MPSLAVHWALAGLIAAALLRDEFDARALAIVLVVTAIPDLDVFIGMVFSGTHRAALHNLFVPGIAGALLYYDLHYRETSLLLARWGQRGAQIAWVSLFSFVVAGIGMDLFWNGANLLYPVHDRFYRLWGKVVISSQRGLVQTIWQTGEVTEGLSSVGGTTEDTHYSTGVDPSPGKEPADVERIFPIAQGGFQVALIVTSVVVTSARLWIARRT